MPGSLSSCGQMVETANLTQAHCPSGNFMKGLRCGSREIGHNRVPAPPERITGISMSQIQGQEIKTHCRHTEKPMLLRTSASSCDLISMKHAPCFAIEKNHAPATTKIPGEPQPAQSHRQPGRGRKRSPRSSQAPWSVRGASGFIRLRSHLSISPG